MKLAWTLCTLAYLSQKCSVSFAHILLQDVSDMSASDPTRCTCTHSPLLESSCAWGADLGSSHTAECGVEEAGQQPALPGQIPGLQRD